ncbi:MAG: HIT domain-containing protein [Rhodospirillaceae bacterium]|nr:HIT domain-containing protein [Rhodospirillaceae bacterium]
MSSDPFSLHPQLAADCLVIGDWPLCRVLRMNDRTFPWLILVPRRAGMRDIIDLGEADQMGLMREIGLASQGLRRQLSPDKLNVAALGNAVPQLHVHVIARFVGDPAWPKPVWGVTPAVQFDPPASVEEAAHWRQALGPFQ